MLHRNKLFSIWEIIRWLDEVCWNKEEMRQVTIPGPVYESLGSKQKILVHWLAYVTDQQRPYEDVWTKGAPIFAEIVKNYTEEPGPGFDALTRFTSSSGKRGGVDIFTSKRQSIDGQPIKYTPRFGMHIISIATTLHLLEQFNRNWVQYLSDNWNFIAGAKQPKEGDNRVSRIAFLMYLLTYSAVKRGMVSFETNEKGIKRHIENHSKRVKRLLDDKEELVKQFYRWSNKERFHKRLWAALLDYLKPGSPYRAHFIEALEDLGNDGFLGFLKEENEILESLELPGDIWNLRFVNKIFKEDIGSPSELRERYRTIIQPQNMGAKFYPEQFDVSFSFSPHMCDEMMEDYCPFRVDSDIRKFCLQTMGMKGENNLCPVAMVTCGFRYYCRSQDCPIKDEIETDLCPGCSVEIETT